MAVLKHTYLECHDNPSNKHAYYLLLLIQEGSVFKTLGYYGRIGNAHQVASKYSGPSRVAAEAEFDKVAWDKGHKRGDPSYLPSTLPSHFQNEITRLNQQSPATATSPTVAPKAAPAPRPAPSAPFPLPDLVALRVVDAATYAAAMASPAYGATTLNTGSWVFCVIPAKGKAQIIARDRFPAPDSLNRFPALVASIDPANPVLADSILVGDVEGAGKGLRLWDILTYRGYDLRAMPLSDRLALLYQAINELAREGQLNAAWSLAECVIGTDKMALASKGKPLALRNLASAYDPADPTAALRRS